MVTLTVALGQPRRDVKCEHPFEVLDLQTIGIEMTPEELDELYWETLEGLYGKRGLA